MAPKSKDGRARLKEPLATDAAAFRAAMGLGVTEVGLIRDAVRSFIDARLTADDALRARFEVERARLMQERVTPLRLVKTENDQGAPPVK